MAKPLVPISVSAPGFYGLNSQAQGSVATPVWATEFLNIVFDSNGRPAARKGTRKLHSSAVSGSPTIRQIFEYIDGAGNTLEIFTGGNAIYKNISGTITDISGTITTPSADNWKFQNFNGKVIGVQADHNMIAMTAVGGSFADVTLSGTQQPTTAVNEILASNGRLWALDQQNLKYSDLLDHTAWNGVFDLTKYWKDGVDEAVALADWNGYLVVFGKRSIIVFSAPYDPASTMQIVENIGGFGCIARDSVQAIGKDMVFLSKSGVRSLGRTIQEKSAPIGDISKNVRDDLYSKVSSEVAANIRSVYSEVDGFYLLSLPNSPSTYCFDTRFPLEDGTYRVSLWDIGPTALCQLLGGSVRMAITAGYISQYIGYIDGANSDTTNGSTYYLKYASSWLDFADQGAGNMLKILKNIKFLIGGARGDTVTMKWGVDFSNTFNSFSVTRSIGTIAKYGVAKYTIGVYSGILTFDEVRGPASKAGRVLRFGLEVEVNRDPVSIQDAVLYAKAGRLAA